LPEFTSIVADATGVGNDMDVAHAMATGSDKHPILVAQPPASDGPC